MLTRFLQSNTPGMKSARTIVQGVIAVLLVAIPEMVTHYDLPYWVVAVAIPVLMAILAPLMALVRSGNDLDGVL